LMSAFRCCSCQCLMRSSPIRSDLRQYMQVYGSLYFFGLPIHAKPCSFLSCYLSSKAICFFPFTVLGLGPTQSSFSTPNMSMFSKDIFAASKLLG
jgi:hypothetical protein